MPCAVDLEDIAASAEFCSDYLLAFCGGNQLLLGEMLSTSAHVVMLWDVAGRLASTAIS